jgi:thioredoxin
MGFLKNLFFRPPRAGKPIPITDVSFQQKVLGSDLPVVVDFWSPGCTHCQVMGGLLDEIGPDYVGRVNIFKANVEQNPQTAMRYQIRGVPTVILFHRGKSLERIVGLMPLKPLRAKLDSLARKA